MSRVRACALALLIAFGVAVVQPSIVTINPCASLSPDDTFWWWFWGCEKDGGGGGGSGAS
jgi:hypothetical protein